MDDAHEQARHVMKQAQAAARRGDFTAADRWSKTAERLALAAARLDDNPPPVSDEEADARLVDEMLERPKCNAACDLDSQAREKERDIHSALAAYAQRHGTEAPPPLRPCPADEETLRQLAMGERGWRTDNLPPALR